MSKEITKIDREDFETAERAIEFDGEIYDLPKRTGELNDRLEELEKKRSKMNEYDFYAEIMPVIFGKQNAKKILKDGNKTNLDLLSKIYRVAFALIFADKLEAEKEEMEKQVENISPFVEKLEKVNPFLRKM